MGTPAKGRYIDFVGNASIYDPNSFTLMEQGDFDVFSYNCLADFFCGFPGSRGMVRYIDYIAIDIVFLDSGGFIIYYVDNPDTPGMSPIRVFGGTRECIDTSPGPLSYDCPRYFFPWGLPLDLTVQLIGVSGPCPSIVGARGVLRKVEGECRWIGSIGLAGGSVTMEMYLYEFIDIFDEPDFTWYMEVNGCAVQATYDGLSNCTHPLDVEFNNVEISNPDAVPPSDCCHCEGIVSTQIRVRGGGLPRKVGRYVGLGEVPELSNSYKLFAVSECCPQPSPGETPCCSQIATCSLEATLIGTGACACLSGTYTLHYIGGVPGGIVWEFSESANCPTGNDELFASLECRPIEGSICSDFIFHLECSTYTLGTGFLFNNCCEGTLTIAVPMQYTETPPVPTNYCPAAVEIDDPKCESVIYIVIPLTTVL